MIKPSQQVGAAAREPAGGEMPVEPVRCWPFDGLFVKTKQTGYSFGYYPVCYNILFQIVGVLSEEGNCMTVPFSITERRNAMESPIDRIALKLVHVLFQKGMIDLELYQQILNRYS